MDLQTSIMKPTQFADSQICCEQKWKKIDQPLRCQRHRRAKVSVHYREIVNQFILKGSRFSAFSHTDTEGEQDRHTVPPEVDHEKEK